MVGGSSSPLVPKANASGKTSARLSEETRRVVPVIGSVFMVAEGEKTSESFCLFGGEGIRDGIEVNTAVGRKSGSCFTNAAADPPVEPMLLTND